MSLKSLESGILTELKTITGRRSLRLKDLSEWSTSEATIDENIQNIKEDKVYVPHYKVWCAVLKKEAANG